MKLQLFSPGTDTPPQTHPFFADLASCGFPSPAGDYIQSDLDLHEYCIRHPSATYYLRASGDSMADGSLYNGDLLVVDSAEKPRHGDIVVASVQGEFTVKRLLLTPRLTLQPMNATWSPSILTRTNWTSLASSRTSSTVPGRCTDVCPGRCEQLLCQL
jgi:DNA polymerase V